MANQDSSGVFVNSDSPPNTDMEQLPPSYFCFDLEASLELLGSTWVPASQLVDTRDATCC